MNSLLIKILIFINLLSSIGIPCLGHYIDKISIYYFIISIISFLGIIFIKRKLSCEGFFKFIFIYYIVLFVPTIINYGDINLLICEAIINLTTIIIWNSFNKEEFYKYLPILVLVLEILTYVNLFLVFKFPNGMYNLGSIRKYYLFDHVNVTFRYLLPGCCFNMIRSYINCNKLDKRCRIYLFTVILTLIITWPATAIVGMIIFIASFLIYKKFPSFLNILTPIRSFFASVIVFILIITIQFQTFFVNIISNILQKDITFTGRINIWNNAIYYIKNKLFMGYGRLSTSIRTLYFNATSAHNQFLIFIFEGGIVLFTLVTIIHIIISKKIKTCSNRFVKTIILATIVSYVFMWITEPFSYSGTLLMFLIWLCAYRSEYWFEQKNMVILHE